AVSRRADVSLSSAGPSRLILLSSDPVAASAAPLSFPTRRSSDLANQSGSVTASYGSASQSVNISLAVAPAVISSLQCNPTTLGEIGRASCRVRLSKAAGSGGVEGSQRRTGLGGVRITASVNETGA